MGRLLVLLVLAVELTAPTGSRSAARADIQIAFESPAAAVQLAVSSLSNSKRLAVTCLGCTKKACGACAIACTAYCAAGPALFSRPGVLPPVIFSGSSVSISSPFEGIGKPPDPYPPRPIVIG
jgi:hypothetical protein